MHVFPGRNYAKLATLVLTQFSRGKQFPLPTSNAFEALASVDPEPSSTRDEPVTYASVVTRYLAKPTRSLVEQKAKIEATTKSSTTRSWASIVCNGKQPSASRAPSSEMMVLGAAVCPATGPAVPAPAAASAATCSLAGPIVKPTAEPTAPINEEPAAPATTRSWASIVLHGKQPSASRAPSSEMMVLGATVRPAPDAAAVFSLAEPSDEPSVESSVEPDAEPVRAGC